MGLFDKLRSAFRKEPSAAHSVPKEPAPQQGDMVAIYDKFGREYLVPKEEWRQKVLPDQIAKQKDDPDALYSTILMALQDGLFEDVAEASMRLLAIDTNKERSHVARAIILTNTGDVDGAESLLNAYIKTHESTGTVLTNLAKVYAQREEHRRAESTLWDALKLDPNQDNGLLWWATLHRDRSGDSGFWGAMQDAATIPGAWRPQLWLARHALDQKDLREAKNLYDQILRSAADAPDVLMMISGDLGTHGHVNEILDTVLPLYDPAKHDVRVGMNILQACLETKNWAEGEKLLHRLFALDRPDIKSPLMRYSAEFDKLRLAARPRQSIDNPPLNMAGISLERPIWTYGLNDPKWLFRHDTIRSQGVAFISLANTTATGITEITEQSENDLGRLTRSIPLYLAESLYCWTELRPKAVIPILMGRGPVVTGKDWPSDQVLQLAGEDVHWAVSGSISEKDAMLTLTLSVWNCHEKRIETSFTAETTSEQFGRTVLTLEKDILAHLAPTSTTCLKPRESVYLRPTPRLASMYLSCLGQSLMMTLVHNGYVDRAGHWGERNMFECYLNAALEMKDNQVTRILLLAALAKSRAYGSSVYQEFKPQALQLLEDETSKRSEFYRLSPLLYQTFGMDAEFEQRRDELLKDADPLYRQWLSDLTKREPSSSS